MPTGTVKWFNNAKGYGFILPDEGGEDLFVHYTSIIMDGYKTLKAGQTVNFEIIKGGKGLHATNIKAPEHPDRAGEGELSADGGHDETANPAEEREIAASGNSNLKAYS